MLVHGLQGQRLDAASPFEIGSLKPGGRPF